MDEVTRLHGAAFDAWQRALTVWDQFDIATYYAPITETLFWTGLLIDALDKKSAPMFRGLTYARNCAVHGFVVVSETVVEGPGEKRKTKGGPRVGGGAAVVRSWAFTTDPKPYVPNADSRDRWKAQRSDYNENVAEFEVFPLMSSALHELGVNLEPQ